MIDNSLLHRIVPLVMDHCTIDVPTLRTLIEDDNRGGSKRKTVRLACARSDRSSGDMS